MSIYCPLCLGSIVIKYHNHPSYIDDLFFDILYCEQCNTSFVDPRSIDNSLYEQIYKNPYKISGYDRYFELAVSIKKQSDPLNYLVKQSLEYSFIISELRRKYVTGDKILEIGCGLGYLTYALNISGFNTIGTDISDNVIDKATHLFGNYYKKVEADLIDSQVDKYNFIILTEVIEHIEEPIIFLKNLSSLLDTKGIILITTPNKSAFKKNALWVTDAPPIHLWWFSENSFHYIANKLNLHYKIVKPITYHKNAYYYFNKSDRIEFPLFIPKTGKRKDSEKVLSKEVEKSDSKIKKIVLFIIRFLIGTLPFRRFVIRIRNILMKSYKTEIPYTMCIRLYVK